MTPCSSTPESSLPGRHAAWVEELLGAAIPAETAADCANCSMCTDGAPSPAGFSFDPAVKCCSYVPVLPNFTVGRILADDDPALARGRSTVLERIARRESVTPLGLGRSPRQEAQYEHVTDAGGFGRSTEIRCPHFDLESGGCGIWRHRNAVCATWHCKHERGARGEAMWSRLQQLLSGVETALAQWCALQLELDPEVLAHVVAEPADAPDHRAVWGNWAGREEELFLACSELVEPLSWAAIERICGPDTAIAERLLREAHRQLQDPELPERLRVGSYRVAETRAEGCRVYGHSPLDGLELPHALLAALPYFDGRPIGEALSELRDELDLDLAPDLLATLVDFEILRPTD